MSTLAIRHDHTVVLRSEIGLHSLAVHRSPLVNVFTGIVAANEGDGLDVGMVANSVDSVYRAMDPGDGDEHSPSHGHLRKLTR